MFSRPGQGEELGVTRDIKIEWRDGLVNIASLEITQRVLALNNHLLTVCGFGYAVLA